MLNAYPDSIGRRLADTVELLKRSELKDAFSLFYILPTFFNSDLDRGFSVIDYNLNEELVSPDDLDELNKLGMLYQLRSPGAHRAISLFGLVSLAVHGLAVGKVGANSNYFLEYSWCAALALAPLFDRLIRQATANTAHVMLTIVVMLASVHSLSQATTSLKHLRETAALWPDYIEWLNEWQQSVCGPVASIRPGAQLLQGFEPYILDPHIIARLSEQNRFDESGLIRDLASGNIGAVIAADDISANPGAFSNWSIAVRNAVAQHYVKADAFGYLSVWVAKTSTDTDCNRPANVGSSQSLSEPDRPVYTVTSNLESTTSSLSGTRYRTRTHTAATSPPGLFLF